MTEESHGGGKLVEFFDPHKINYKGMFQSPQSKKRTGTLSACVLGVRLPCRAVMSS